MFIERTIKERRGWIEVICGSMFSGKTEELIRRLRRAKIAQLNVEIYKPKLDTRYDDVNVVSHNAISIPSTPVETSNNILLYAQGVDVVGIDEAQFFDDELPFICERLAKQGTRVIIAGLDKDYLGKSFGPMPELLAMADDITKLHAICIYCGDLATHSYRLGEQDKQIMLGETSEYTACCRTCFYDRMNSKKS